MHSCTVRIIDDDVFPTNTFKTEIVAGNPRDSVLLSSFLAFAVVFQLFSSRNMRIAGTSPRRATT